MTDSASTVPSQPIRERTISAYLDALAAPQPAPGGGSVAGLTGALAAALGQMVVSLTDDEEATAALGATSHDISALLDALLGGSEADERAYSGYIEATGLPKASKEEKAARRAAMQVALRRSAEAPLGIAEAALGLLDHLEPVARHGGSQTLSDAVIAVTLARASVASALVTVRVNLPLIKNDEVSASFKSRADDLERRAADQAETCFAILRERRSG